jgi:hypothetical protein
MQSSTFLRGTALFVIGDSPNHGLTPSVPVVEALRTPLPPNQNDWQNNCHTNRPLSDGGKPLKWLLIAPKNVRVASQADSRSVLECWQRGKQLARFLQVRAVFEHAQALIVPLIVQMIIHYQMWIEWGQP